MRRVVRPRRPRWARLSVFALVLSGCPGDDGAPSSSGASSSSRGVTADPSAADTGSTTRPGSSGSTESPTSPQVVMETTLGTLVIELDEQAAPVTTANFLAYVEAGFYDGSDGQGATTFHRVIPGYVIQGGGFTEQGVQKPTMGPIVNESGNGLSNVRGSIGMARTDDPDSATSEFYFDLVDNLELDAPPGYAVFGHLVEGLDVMDAIASVPTNAQDAPQRAVIILSTTVR